MARILITRHGQTKENADGIIQSPESGLTQLGRRQAKILAEKLENEKIDKIYVSNFKRARETAEEIVKLQPAAEIVYTEKLREKNAGIFIGRPLEEQTKAREKSCLSFYDFRPEKGESLVDVQRRIVKFYKQLLKEEKGKTVLAITHQGPIIALLLYLFEKSFKEYGSYHMENTAIAEIVVEELTKPIIKLSGFPRILADG